MIFENGSIRWQPVIAKIVAAYLELPEYTPPRSRRPSAPNPIDHSIPWAFFNGAAQQHGCGGDFILYLSDQHHYKVKMGLGVGTNNFVELITLRNLMHFALNHECRDLQIYGDSNIIINWINLKSRCYTHTLLNILDEVMHLKSQFNNIIVRHIYREHNHSADGLSKEATHLPGGQWIIHEQRGISQYQYYHMPYIDQIYPWVDDH